MALEAGMWAETEIVVTDAMTAAAVGSGLVAGLSTPSMIGLMEGAAVKAVSAHLEAGTSTVGSRIDVAHLAPTPVGMSVRARAVLDVVEGRRLVFSVSVADEVGEVGRGTHERFVIDLARFAQRMNERLATGGSEDT